MYTLKMTRLEKNLGSEVLQSSPLTRDSLGTSPTAPPNASNWDYYHIVLGTTVQQTCMSPQCKERFIVFCFGLRFWADLRSQQGLDSTCDRGLPFVPAGSTEICDGKTGGKGGKTPVHT